MFLHYDYDTHVAFVTNRGASYMSLFYLNEKHASGKPTFIPLDKYKRNDNATLI